MGLGDEVMLTADARRMQQVDPRPVAVRAKKGPGARWDSIWDNNPRLVRPENIVERDVQWLDNASGRRPYIDYAKTTKERYAFRDEFRAEPGEIYLTDAERERAKAASGRLLIEPNTKPGMKPTKDWGWAKWERLATLLSGMNLVQIGPAGSRKLSARPNLQFVETGNARMAAAAVSRVSAVVCIEGGLHHCAAAFNRPAVVIFGHYISPQVTGYDSHVNIFRGEGAGCGVRGPCESCRRALDSITPEEVAYEASMILTQSEAA